jgi:Rieske Fe-S protein
MVGGLAAGYGGFGVMAGRFLFPAREESKGFMLVEGAMRLQPGESLTFRLPSGKPVAIARVGRSGDVSDFLTLSSTCPHLGCQVHWEPQNGRFFCPCHNGTFDPSGKATGGPPRDAGQSLPRYPLKLEKGLIFIEVPLEAV